VKLALKITPYGDATEIEIDTDELKKLQEAVDGLIQPVDFVFGSKYLTMWVNEEGLLRNDLVMNPVALAFHYSPIMGNIVITGAPDDSGETTSLSSTEADAIKKLCEKLVGLVEKA
jgi:hypothetical protein